MNEKKLIAVVVIVAFCLCAALGTGIIYRSQLKAAARDKTIAVLTNTLARRIAKSNDLLAAREFEQATAALQELEPKIAAMRDGNLEEQLRQAMWGILDAKRDYEAKLKQGYSPFEGKFISKADKARILAERERREDLERERVATARAERERLATARAERERLATEARARAERKAARTKAANQRAKAEIEERKRRQATELWELKGDRLGMALNDFKAQYRRSVSGHDETAPWCSDTRPRQEIITLLSESYFTDAHIVSCRTTFPFEDSRGNAPTIAGVTTEILIYHFVDNRLFKITAWLPHDGFSKVKRALRAKYGKPSLSETQEYQNRMGARFPGETIVWKNDVSTITLFERMSSLDTSALFFWHNKLLSIAEERKPGPSTDDL